MAKFDIGKIELGLTRGHGRNLLVAIIVISKN
jgi:hypothetical protein